MMAPHGGMEAAAAVALWRRSRQYDMIYKTFVSDGDSSAFRSVCGMYQGARPYGDQCPVVKAECINHVAKRLGTGLRALKKTKSDAEKPAIWEGRHKLTDVFIDHLQFYFQVSLSRKVGTTASEMREEIMSTSSTARQQTTILNMTDVPKVKDHGASTTEALL